MMKALEKRWKEYWEKRSTPGLGQDSEEFYAQYAKELRLLFNRIEPRRVLEIGCGNGALFRHLGFDKAEVYRGVDFAGSMLAVFCSNHPEVETVCASGYSYRDANLYDLIFSNQVVQFFDPRMLSEHFRNATAMLQPGGLFVCASVLWRRLRFAYARGDLMRGRTVGFRHGYLRALLSYVKNRFHDSNGVWYDFPELVRQAQANNLSCTFYGSMHFMYRFHAVFARRD